MRKFCLIAASLLVLLLVVSIVLAIFQKNIPLQSRVALVRVEGPIIDSRDTVDEIKEYVEDASIKAIVLRVDSPGGAVAPSQEIYSEVKKAAEKKKVVVSMGSLAASGGYYISAPATMIVANPGTLTGSIGVIMEIPNVEGLMSKIGVRTEVIKSGEHKDIASAFRSLEPDERKILQDVMDNVHRQFIRAVSEGRKLALEEVEKIADGRIFTGEQAVQNGLVDKLGTLDDTVNIAGELAGISGKPEVVEKKGRYSIIDFLRNKFPRELADVFPSISIKYFYSP